MSARLASLEARLAAAEAGIAALEATRPSLGWSATPVCPACGATRFVAGGCPRWDCPCGPSSDTTVTVTRFLDGTLMSPTLTEAPADG